jgi:hypothetical protein
MKTIFKMSLIVLIFSTSSCKTILISEKKVPTEKICGSDASYECEATGFGSAKPYVRIFKKKRPNPDGKGTFAGLGRSADLKIFHNTNKVIELDSSEVSIVQANIDYDLKKDNVTELIADLNAELKEQKINADLSAQIKNEFNSQLNNFLKIEAYFVTYTITDETIQDRIRDAYKGLENDPRFVTAAQRLKEGNQPLIRQVITIREVVDFTEKKSLKNILTPIIKAKLGETNPKVDLVINGTLKRDKTENFSSNYDRTSIYSYGYFSDEWMYKK